MVFLKINHQNIIKKKEKRRKNTLKKTK